MLRHPAVALWPGGRGAASFAWSAVPATVARLAPQGSRVMSSGSGDEKKKDKKPPNSYALFVQARMGQLKQATSTQATSPQGMFKAIGIEWSGLPQSEKDTWSEKAKQHLEALGHPLCNLHETKKKPPSAYNLFVKNLLTSTSGNFKEAGAAWKAASAEVKAEFAAKAKAAAEGFTKPPKHDAE